MKLELEVKFVDGIAYAETTRDVVDYVYDGQTAVSRYSNERLAMTYGRPNIVLHLVAPQVRVNGEWPEDFPEEKADE